ncbi:hypothetical protein CDD81_5710 [Ophiocordyceps australis]|uniref:MI domain-containing protein n=1 Tax=Ophiocordyceps australis TaxID=1399860 RepID=A0A2C5X6U3_9HYPO|nr:hypothetical protein CDD81_5710 [Ophiocordyceps australis]
MRNQLAKDEADIAYYKKKLGIKTGRRCSSTAFKEDGLDTLVVEEEEDICHNLPIKNNKKRKQDYDEWLSAKRSKTSTHWKYWDSVYRKRNQGEAANSSQYGQDSETPKSVLYGEERALYVKENDEFFADFDAYAEDRDSPLPEGRGNPFAVPLIDVSTASHVVSHRNDVSASHQGNELKLKRQIQGQINRLTDSNILSIVQVVDAIYQQNPRGHVTELLTDAVLAQICKSDNIPDQFFVLTGGFCAAIYKVIGPSFGSHLLRRVVKDFATQYQRASETNQAHMQKASCNIMSLLTQLYTFGIVSCRIIFDYMQRLLQQLSEINVELLLRVCRMSGSLLRRDDRERFRHISDDLARAISYANKSDASSRTKFMMETIQKLSTGKQKIKQVESFGVSEHIVRMRKHLGELKSQSRRLDGLAPMGIGLGDIEGAKEHGKWWLAGASVPNSRGQVAMARDMVATRQIRDSLSGEDEEDMNLVLPDFYNKARTQGLTTKAQIAIFTALMTANSHEEGYSQYQNLRLKKDEQLEIAHVLVQCVGSEAQYNEYYALVAKQACAKNKRIKFAFQDRVWKLLRSLGEPLFGEEMDEDERRNNEGMKDERRIKHVARFYASLVGNGILSIRILKPLELHEVNKETATFVECFLVSLLRASKRITTSYSRITLVYKN